MAIEDLVVKMTEQAKTLDRNLGEEREAYEKLLERINQYNSEVAEANAEMDAEEQVVSAKVDEL